MSIEKETVLKNIQELDQMYAAMSQITRLPYLEPEMETGHAQAFLFTDAENCKIFLEDYLKDSVPLFPVEIAKDEMLEFYLELHLLGIEDVVFNSGREILTIPLAAIVDFSDFPQGSPDKAPQKNDRLKKAAALFQQELYRPNQDEQAEERRQTLGILQEAMIRALGESRFMIPYKCMDPAIRDLKDAPEGSIQWPTIQMSDDRLVQPIFSDTTEFRKFFGTDPDMGAMIVPFPGLLNCPLEDSNGYVLNPTSIAMHLSPFRLEIMMQMLGIEENQ